MFLYKAGYEKTTKRKIFGIGGKGKGRSKAVSEAEADEINESIDKNADYKKHELLDNEDPESWEYDENGKPTELKEAKASKKLKKDYKLENPTKCGAFLDKMASPEALQIPVQAIKHYLANKQAFDEYADTPGPDKDPQEIEMINNVRTYVASEGLEQIPLYTETSEPQGRLDRLRSGALHAGLPSALLTGILNAAGGGGKALKSMAMAGGIGTGLGYLLSPTERKHKVPVGSAFVRTALAKESSLKVLKQGKYFSKVAKELSSGEKNRRIFSYTLENSGIDSNLSQEQLWEVYNGAHEKAWKELTNFSVDSPEFKAFKNASGTSNKAQVIKRFAKTTDPNKLFGNVHYRQLDALEKVYDQ